MDIDFVPDTSSDSDYVPYSPSFASQHPDIPSTELSKKWADEYFPIWEQEVDDQEDPFDEVAAFSIHSELPIPRLTAVEVSRAVTLDELGFDLVLSAGSGILQGSFFAFRWTPFPNQTETFNLYFSAFL
jgi:hypothetical protein